MDKKEWIIKAIKAEILNAINYGDNLKDFKLLNIYDPNLTQLMVWGTLEIYFKFSNFLSVDELISILKDWDFLANWSIYRGDSAIYFEKK